MRIGSAIRSEFESMRGSFVVRAMVLVLAGVSAPAVARPGPVSPADQPAAGLQFGEEIDVRVINLEVVVEDRSGNRVHGLQADDFRLVVDGLEVGVDYFTEILENRAVEGRDGQMPPAVAAGGPVTTNYVLFVDDDHTHVTFRRPVLFGFDKRLKELPEQDRVAVVVQSRRRLEILSPFTTDREATRRALAELDRGGRYGGHLRSRGPRAQATVRTALSGNGEPMSSSEGGSVIPSYGTDRLAVALAAPRTFSENVANAALRSRDLRFSVDAVISTMRALDVPEGRKVLLLLAGNWPTGYFEPRGRRTGFSTDLELLDGLIDTANLLGYTVYPMDQQSSNPNFGLWQNLRHIARDTGGKAFMAGSNVKALSIVDADTASYYWLGFMPEYRRDDRPHDIRVEVLRSGLRVRSRRGYLDLSRRTEADMEAQRALLFPDQANAGPLLVDVGEPERVNRRTMSVPVTVYLPVGRFPALPAFEGRFVQGLELRFATVDWLGRQGEIIMTSLALGGAAQPAPDEVVAYRTFLSMRRKPHDLVVTVHDPVSRLTASARLPLVP